MTDNSVAKTRAWHYGKTGVGFGYHDFRTIWFYDGKVTRFGSGRI